MNENILKNKINDLKSEILMKNKEINEYLDKIDYLENMIMEIEASLSEKSSKANASLLKIHLKDMERENRELKNKLSLLGVENVKLKQELEMIKKGHDFNSSLIQVVENSITSHESKSTIPEEVKTREDEISQEELFKYIKIRCPECETQKKLKIPAKIINQSHYITTITIPKGMVCGHSFQVFVDKSFTIRRYQVIDFEFHKMEYYKSRDIEELQKEKDDFTYFAPLPFFQDIVNLLREIIDDREILGITLFTNKGNVIYASVPSNILFNIIKEFEFRKEKNLQDMTKMFIELKSHQKFYSEHIEIQGKDFILVLIFSEKVNFGMGSMLFRNIKKKLKKFTQNHKNGEI